MSGSYIIITTTSGHLKQVSDGDIQAFIKAQLPMIPEREIILVRENSAERIRAKVTCELDSGMYTSTYCVWTLCLCTRCINIICDVTLTVTAYLTLYQLCRKLP